MSVRCLDLAANFRSFPQKCPFRIPQIDLMTRNQLVELKNEGSLTAAQLYFTGNNKSNLKNECLARVAKEH